MYRIRSATVDKQRLEDFSGLTRRRVLVVRMYGGGTPLRLTAKIFSSAAGRLHLKDVNIVPDGPWLDRVHGARRVAMATATVASWTTGNPIVAVLGAIHNASQVTVGRATVLGVVHRFHGGSIGFTAMRQALNAVAARLHKIGVRRLEISGTRRVTGASARTKAARKHFRFLLSPRLEPIGRPRAEDDG